MASETDSASIVKVLDIAHLLPDRWAEIIVDLVEKHSIHTVLDGSDSTSREPIGTPPVSVHVVTGDIVRNHAAWLYELYVSGVIDLVEHIVGKPVYPSKDIRSGININSLKGSGSRYEWHVDSNPVTGVLFVTDHVKGEGGELVLQHTEKQFVIYPKAGCIAVFKGQDLPHAVMPLLSSGVRISVPMSYFLSADEQDRPLGLSDYLYSAL